MHSWKNWKWVIALKYRLFLGIILSILPILVDELEKRIVNEIEKEKKF